MQIVEHRNATGKGGTFSIIGADVIITGDVKAGADLHIDGTVEGNVQCTSLVQGNESTIKGVIETDSARMAGTVIGSIKAGNLIIAGTAKIEGDVEYEQISVEQGSSIEGSLSNRNHQPANALSAQNNISKANIGVDKKQDDTLLLNNE